MTTLYIIRHAEADGNVYRRIHGQYNGFVTPRGYEQIRLLHRRFSDTNIDAVYASDLYRTCETARAISEGHGLEINRTPALREINLGVWEDRTWGEVMLEHRADYAIWEKTPDKFKIPGSESYMQIYTRAKAALDSIVKKHPDGTVAAVTHGTVIRALIAMLKFGDMARVDEVQWCDNTGVAKLCVDESLSYSIEYINDNSHLSGLSTLSRQRWWTDNSDPCKSNLNFIPVQFPCDLEKADSFYRKSWCSVFPDSTYDSAYIRSRLKKIAAAHPQAIMFARQGEGHEIGMVALDTRTRLFPNSGHIVLIYLDEEHRGLELGAQLLGHAVSVYRALGRRYVTVRAASCNPRALKFYEKYGFEQFSAEQTENTLQLLLRKPIDGTPAYINWK